ncbi:MAG: tRNA lysidine(34) synthetase TilS, partial [Bacteroidota bacterium]
MSAAQNLLNHLRKNWSKTGILPQKGRILVAISGGADSVWLAHALTIHEYPIALAHVNYGLRKDADAEEALVRQYASTWNVPIHVLHTDPKSAAQGQSLQMEARYQRYAFFEELMQTHGYVACATAHHADDQAETLLMSLLDGNGRQIWKGIPAIRGPYIRPLLSIRKADIRTALADADLKHGEDHTNALPVYRRNQLRLNILPNLEEMAPGLIPDWQQKWQRTLRRNRLYDRLLAKQAQPGLQVSALANLF